MEVCKTGDWPQVGRALHWVLQSACCCGPGQAFQGGQRSQMWAGRVIPQTTGPQGVWGGRGRGEGVSSGSLAK